MEQLESKKGVNKWRRRGSHSESVVVKVFENTGYKAVNLPQAYLP